MLKWPHPASVSLLLATLATNPATAAADTWDDPIVTDRPDITESSQTVGAWRLQLEMGTVVGTHKSDGTRTTFVRTPIKARLGIFAPLEIHLEPPGFGANWHSQTDASSSVTGIHNLAFGFKLHFFDQDDWLPSAALLVSFIAPVGTDGLAGSNWGVVLHSSYPQKPKWRCRRWFHKVLPLLSSGEMLRTASGTNSLREAGGSMASGDIRAAERELKAGSRRDRDVSAVLRWIRQDPEFSSLVAEAAIRLGVAPTQDEAMVRQALERANKEQRRLLLSKEEEHVIRGSIALALAGVADPSPTTDAVGAGVSAHMGSHFSSEYYWDVPWFVLGWIPYAGDLGKVRLLVKLRSRLRAIHSTAHRGLESFRRNLPKVRSRAGGTAIATNRVMSHVPSADEIARAIKDLEERWGLCFGQSFIFIEGKEGRKGVKEYVEMIRDPNQTELPLPWIVKGVLADGHHMAVAMQLTGSWCQEVKELAIKSTDAARRSGQLEGWRFKKTPRKGVTIFDQAFQAIRNAG